MKGSMKVIDLNADLGEADNRDWAQAEYAMLAYVSSANIACGGHAGTPKSMRHMVRGAVEHGVAIGAHPAYPDKAHFGRRSLELGRDISKDALSDSLMEQITTLAEIAAEQGSFLTYVKPHGALYNDAVKDAAKADIIASTIAAIDRKLSLMGAPLARSKTPRKTMGYAILPKALLIGAIWLMASFSRAARTAHLSARSKPVLYRPRKSSPKVLSPRLMDRTSR